MVEELRDCGLEVPDACAEVLLGLSGTSHVSSQPRVEYMSSKRTTSGVAPDIATKLEMSSSWFAGGADIVDNVAWGFLQLSVL